MEGRVDIEKYSIASHIQQNFLPLKQGASMFRAGTAYVQPVKNSANRSWLRRFEFSQTQAFVLEFGDRYVRFYTNHGPLLITTAVPYSTGLSYPVGATVNYLGIIYYAIAAVPVGSFSPPNATYWAAMQPYNGSATTAIYEIQSPYAVADLTDSLGEFTLQIEQSGDVLYLAGGIAGAGYQPYTLTRFSNSPPNWAFAVYAPVDGPFIDALPLVPGSEIAMTVSAVQGNITINAYGGTPFAPTDVGRLVRIGEQTFNITPWIGGATFAAGQYCSNNGNNYLALSSGLTGQSGPLHTTGAVYDGSNAGVLWLYTDSGYGVAQITGYVSGSQVNAKVIQRFPINCVGSVSGTITAASQGNPCTVTATNAFTLGDAVFLVGVGGMTNLNQTVYTVGTASGSAFQLAGLDSTGFPAFTSGGIAVQNASTEWQLGSWSATTEWPRALAFFKDRLFWAGKLNIWGSVVGKYSSHAPDQFGVQTTDSALNVLLTGSDASNINWLSSAIILLVGSQGGEYGLDAANYVGSPLGPANVENLRQSQWRSRSIRPELVGTTVLYVQRAGRKLFASDYNFYLNRYDSTDQSKFSYHITIGGITSIAAQQEPWCVIWATRADGTLLSYTFNREDNVTAWARHNLGGNGLVESIAVIPAPDGLRDELWMIVNRTINGVTARYVEYMSKHYEGPQAGYAGDPQASAWYLDCAAQSVATPPAGATTTTVILPTNPATGQPYLAGMTVGIFADGGKQPQQVVPPSGSLTIQGAFTTVTVGLPYQGNLVPMRPEGGADSGTAQGKLKQGQTLVLRLIDAQGGVVGQLSNINATTQLYQDPLGLTTQSPQDMEAIRYNDTTTALNSPPPIQSGDFPVSFPTRANSDQDQTDFYILVQQNDPFPMTVAGLFPSYKVEDRQ
jgi:hypothetical protein